MKFKKLFMLISMVFLCATTMFAATVIDQASGKWNTTGNLSTGRFGINAILLKDGKVLVAGGIGNSFTVLSSAEVYDPADGQWSATGSMTTARAYYGATLLVDGRVLVTGGCTEPTCYHATSSAEIFDPATGAWQSTGNMSTERWNFTATLLQNGNVLAVGGCTLSPCSSPTQTTELYDPTTGGWSPSGSLPLGRSQHAATRLHNGRVLITGGFSYVGAQPLAELYNPATGRFTSMASMATGRMSHTATLLRSGKVLAAAGVSGRSDFRTVNSAEVYDPIANKWKQVKPLKSARGGHTAVLLPNGKVLVAGGITYSPGKNALVLSSAELFGSTKSKWSKAGSMKDTRDNHGMVLLPNGNVLVVGGISNGGTVLASAEIYTP